MSKKQIFKQIGINVIIIAMLGSLGFLALNTGLRSVYVPTTDKVFFAGNIEKNNVSLMINVYWGNEFLDAMLATLDKYKVKTTFFVGGVWVAKYPEKLIEIDKAGHEIGNHGYFHKDHSKLSFSQNQSEIMNTHNIVREFTGKGMKLFAPPSGAYNDQTINACLALGYEAIMWTRDTIDWRDKDADLIYKRAVKNMAGGDLILMHPTKETMEALPRILDYCVEKGFNVIPVSQNIEI